MSSAPPKPITVLTPELSRALKQRSESLLVDIIKKNHISRYVRESPSLLCFRNTLRDFTIFQDTPAPLLEHFRDTVPLSVYDTYEPFIRKLVEKPCKKVDVEDLLSPGYPSYVALSSFTTGKAPKYFPKYDFSRVNPTEGSISATSKFNCLVMHLGTKWTILVEDEDGQIDHKLPVCTISSGITRTMFNMKVDQEHLAMEMKVPALTSPLAVSFINNYRSFILMHALFALAERRLETLSTSFGTILVDLVKFVEEEWDSILNSIETGILPDFDGTDHLRVYLQPYFLANPERAAELRALGAAKDSPEWLKMIWPNFKEYSGIMSGAYTGVLSKVQRYWGPDVALRTAGYILSECWPGISYSGVNLYKLANDEYFEFLEVSQREIPDEETVETAASLIPVWKMEAGRAYEPVITSRDGLWRYRLGDMIQIEGFEPNSGSPIFGFVERRHEEIRIGDATVPANVISNAILSTTEDTIGQVTEFTSFLDSRDNQVTIGYLVEIGGEIGPNPSLARRRVLDALMEQHHMIRVNIEMKKMRLPTIRIVERGTFGAYRHWRVENENVSLAQVKVPVVFKNEELLKQLLKGVVQEIQEP
ncbi:hypothetical protein HYDPIDRAFT_31893 [Hydnomerulius pinastri MD-312]|uniref:GH3 auxin-responsive promoter n=1 Tax=Hydnomerulius pinastri MD-312 TaxID=994086 RepID=A0A0C9V5L7_9AGAM|nr:hypothetical protein HYDPIDRAFT_31893 [Hydnomerulius pinastri MD-312]